MFFNNTEKRGYRITLSGPSNNSAGIGSRIRLVYNNNKKGPSRAIQAGSGYRSQNSFTQVLGASDIPIEIEVIWHDGTTQYTPIEEGEMDYIINLINDGGIITVMPCLDMVSPILARPKNYGIWITCSGAQMGDRGSGSVMTMCLNGSQNKYPINRTQVIRYSPE